MRSINTYVPFLQRMPSIMNNVPNTNLQTKKISSQHEAPSMLNIKGKASWQRWIDHDDIPALNKNAPKGTSYVPVPLHEATGQYAKTKIPNTKKQLAAFNNLQSIKGQPIKELRAENNILKFEEGAYYRFSIGGGQSVIVSSALSQTCYGANISFEDVAAEFGTDIGVFTPGTHRALTHIQLFMQALTTGDTWNFHEWFSPAERIELYAQVGIKPGGWVEIQNQDQTTRFYLDNNGFQWSEKVNEDTRWAMNNKDWRESGATKDSVFQVNGKEYKIDDNGHLNIPKGEPVIYGETVGFPKELGEYMRKTQNWHADDTHIDLQI